MIFTKRRLDLLLLDRHLADSRSLAQRLIMAGQVFVNGHLIDKSSSLIDENSSIDITAQLPYVSRGGLKLKKALDTFNIDLNGQICIDIGASTGGFTDCLLQSGASKVYSIDVGYGQFSWKLRNDSRVVLMERTNIRHVTLDMFQDDLNFATVDVSFISIEKVLPIIYNLLTAGGQVVTLIKPQFEAGRELIGKHGVVKEKSTHLDVIRNIINFSNATGFFVKGLTYSPIKGPAGNIEFLLYLTKTPPNNDVNITEVVEAAHREL